MSLNKTEGDGQNYSFNSFRVVDFYTIGKQSKDNRKTLCKKRVMIKYV